MKRLSCIAMAAAMVSAAGTGSAAAALAPSSFIYETEREFFTTGDFDGDGKFDLAIVDKQTGRIRIGVGSPATAFLFDKYIDSNVKDATGMSVGKLFSEKSDAFVVCAADANNIAAVEIITPSQGGTPVTIPPPGLGPNAVAAVDIGGAGNTPLDDLFVNTTYNSPDPNKGTMFRNTGGNFAKITDIIMPGMVMHANRVTLKTGGPELLGMMLAGDESITFRADNVSSGKLETVADIKNIPFGADYVMGSFRGSPLRDLLSFIPGDNKLTLYSVEEAAGKLQFGAGKDFEMGQPIKNVFVVPMEGADRIVTLFGTGEVGGVFTFDINSGPKQEQEIRPEETTVLAGAAVFPNGFFLTLAPSVGKIQYSTRYHLYKFAGGAWTTSIKGSLPSLADRDDVTVPAIHKLILENLKVTKVEDMKPYTNTIPGTDVHYSMIPIPGGEFMMGSPETEKGHKEDESPLHKVKVEPFWMQQFEITWNEYELFMYPDEERKFKDTIPTDPEIDKVSDAVTRPSKPYVEMSFGMGKDGYPAIAMTHHAANKYCHWLSAKTGHFYRLPTEAEWEYACRAGTTTAYYFGDDPKKLPDYGWFEQNSDFKYQKIGKKKPNPWGLYDMAGNVVEWCLDQYDPNFYAECAKKGLVVEPWNRATQPYPHAVRGGSWDDPALACRSAARRGSDRLWKMQDPQLPKSTWWLSDAQFVGFRIIRPLKVPSPEEMLKYWISGTEKD